MKEIVNKEGLRKLKNKNIYYQILSLTAKKEWVTSPEVVREVQLLGKKIPIGYPSPLKFKEINGVMVVNSLGDARNYPTIDACIANEQLNRATIVQHIRNKSRARDGRTFSIF
jgi:hypothetical protein